MSISLKTGQSLVLERALKLLYECSLNYLLVKIWANIERENVTELWILISRLLVSSPISLYWLEVLVEWVLKAF